jgi:hypothetical protein
MRIKMRQLDCAITLCAYKQYVYKLIVLLGMKTALLLANVL